MLEELGLPYQLVMLPFPPRPVVAQDYTRWFLARLRSLEPPLLASEYLCAGRFTAADVSIGYALLLARHLGLADRFTPGVSRYWERLQARDGYQRVLRTQQEAAVSQGVSPTPAPDLPS